MVVLDTNALLGLYRQPANISLDVLNVLKRIEDNLFIPMQVYQEYLKNYQGICGGEKKKYQKINRELSRAARKIRFNNLIPLGFNDYEKNGADKYGDLFVWNSILNQDEIVMKCII